jgi:hypothetical protein
MASLIAIVLAIGSAAYAQGAMFTIIDRAGFRRPRMCLNWILICVQPLKPANLLT